MTPDQKPFSRRQLLKCGGAGGLAAAFIPVFEQFTLVRPRSDKGARATGPGPADPAGRGFGLRPCLRPTAVASP
jgi:TAT (twin-arginine translocation) pathway signal sequence